ESRPRCRPLPRIAHVVFEARDVSWPSPASVKYPRHCGPPGAAGSQSRVKESLQLKRLICAAHESRGLHKARAIAQKSPIQARVNAASDQCRHPPIGGCRLPNDERIGDARFGRDPHRLDLEVFLDRLEPALAAEAAALVAA